MFGYLSQHIAEVMRPAPVEGARTFVARGKVGAMGFVRCLDADSIAAAASKILREIKAAHPGLPVEMDVQPDDVAELS